MGKDIKTTITARIDAKAYLKLKKYCQANGFTISSVLSKSAYFIVNHKIHPDHFEDNSKRTFNTETWDQIEGNLSEQIAELRQTYVSFQRTFEKNYQHDIRKLQETTFFNSKRLLNLIAKGKEFEGHLSSFVAHLIKIDVIIGSKDGGNIEYDFKKVAMKMIKEKKVNMYEISEAAEKIVAELEK